jgi:hypothetical protein
MIMIISRQTNICNLLELRALLEVFDIITIMFHDYVSGNLPTFQQNTLLCCDPNRLIHNVSTGECGDTVTNFGMLGQS